MHLHVLSDKDCEGCVFVWRLQVFLNTYGIQTQTPQQVEPIQIWPQKELVKVTKTLPVNSMSQPQNLSF